MQFHVVLLLLGVGLSFHLASASFHDLMALEHKLHDYLAKNKSLPVDDILKNWPKFDAGKMTPNFTCRIAQNRSRPTSVHRLQPSDVDVVAAFGDSITAGFGAKATNLVNLFLEYRGISWSIGGDETLETRVTLPNILKKYNPKLTGYATGFNVALFPFASEFLDVAVSGAIADDMLSQAWRAVEVMANSPEINFDNDWKLITIWVGGNDLCSLCEMSHARHTPPRYAADLQDALDLLQTKVPRLFVNLVQILDVTQLHILDKHNLYCSVIHDIECQCATVDNQTVRMNVSQAALEYRALLQQLIDSGRYDTRDDFTVVLQPFFTDTKIPLLPSGKPDLSYFAPDCFHFSQRGQMMSAVALWNNMVEPVGHKSTQWSPKDKFKCLPDGFPYLFTSKNSVEYLNKATPTF